MLRIVVNQFYNGGFTYEFERIISVSELSGQNVRVS